MQCISGNTRCGGCGGVEDEKVSIRGISRMKRQAQQAAFIWRYTARGAGTAKRKRRLHWIHVAQICYDFDFSGLLRNEQSIGFSDGRCDYDGIEEIPRHRYRRVDSLITVNRW